MGEVVNEPKLPDYWNDRRKELRSWFGRNAPSLGKLYEGALYILFFDNFPGRVRFVAHAVREIKNRLPDAVAGPKTNKRLDYVGRLDDLAKEWEKEDFPINGSQPVKVMADDALPTTTYISRRLPRSLYSNIALLVKDHIQTRKKPYDAARRLFQAIDTNNQDAEEMLRPRINQWNECTKWFVKRVHDNSSSTDDQKEDAQEIQRRFEIFEITLSALLRGFFKTLGELDEILEEANF